MKHLAAAAAAAYKQRNGSDPPVVAHLEDATSPQSNAIMPTGSASIRPETDPSTVQVGARFSLADALALLATQQKEDLMKTRSLGNGAPGHGSRLGCWQSAAAGEPLERCYGAGSWQQPTQECASSTQQTDAATAGELSSAGSGGHIDIVSPLSQDGPAASIRQLQ